MGVILCHLQKSWGEPGMKKRGSIMHSRGDGAEVGMEDNTLYSARDSGRVFCQLGWGIRCFILIRVNREFKFRGQFRITLEGTGCQLTLLSDPKLSSLVRDFGHTIYLVKVSIN